MNADSPIHSAREVMAATEHSKESAADAFVAEWRFGRGFSDTELADWLAKIAKRPETTPQTSTELTSAAGYSHYGSEALVASEPPGRPLPDGPFVLARGVLERARLRM